VPAIEINEGLHYPAPKTLTLKRVADRVHHVDVDARIRAPRGPHADARLRSDARGRDGGVREELVEGIGMIEVARVRITDARRRALAHSCS
jgi:hypothetical protein